METCFTERLTLRTFKITIKMRNNQLNSFTKNSLRLSVNERIHQLEKKTDNLNVIQKQLELSEMIEELIDYANTAPHGLVEVIFTDKVLPQSAGADEIILASDGIISGFNVSNPESKRSLMRTVIVVDPSWSADFVIYKGNYNLPTNMLRKI